jgi:hypothetical protein
VWIRRDGKEVVYVYFKDENAAIDDMQAIEAVNRLLLERGYRSISKGDNYVDFLRSTPTLDFGSGVIYSIDGSEPQTQYLTKLVPLSEPNWYYSQIT